MYSATGAGVMNSTGGGSNTAGTKLLAVARCARPLVVPWSRLVLVPRMTPQALVQCTRPQECYGCDIVQSDRAPEAGVAQGIFNGDLIKHQGGHQGEVEEGLEEEVERRVKRRHSSNQTQVRMHG